MTTRQPRGSQVPAIIAVTVIAVLLFGALAAAIGSLNRDVYSAGGFVRQYLESLARRDAASALSLPGVELTPAQLEEAGLPGDLPETLLRASMLGTLEDIQVTGDMESAPGVHVVTSEFRLGGERSTMQFTVQKTGTVVGLFNTWRFQDSPLAVLQVQVLHGAEFTVNGLTLDTRAHAAPDAAESFSNQAAYVAFAPSVYEFELDSALLSAPRTTVPVTGSGIVPVTVDLQPNENFVEKVQGELDSYLTSCAEQQVLLPSNCPFGIDIEDRVQGLPTWSIAEYPVVTLVAGEASFEMPPTAGLAHIVVEVRSLFDGEVSVRDEDVPFTVSLSVTVNADTSLAIRLS